jgi:hypothetical protein
MPKSKSIIALAAAVIIIIAAFAVYAGVTYPRTTVNIPVSFTIGADTKTTVFDQPFLDDKAQVQVTVQTGAALWQAQITSQSNVIWQHSAGQGKQTSYNSGWIELPSGNYNFTFRTVGVGSLNAVAIVTSKGGFW